MGVVGGFVLVVPSEAEQSVELRKEAKSNVSLLKLSLLCGLPYLFLLLYPYYLWLLVEPDLKAC